MQGPGAAHLLMTLHLVAKTEHTKTGTPGGGGGDITLLNSRPSKGIQAKKSESLHLPENRLATQINQIDRQINPNGQNKSEEELKNEGTHYC